MLQTSFIETVTQKVEEQVCFGCFQLEDVPALSGAFSAFVSMFVRRGIIFSYFVDENVLLPDTLPRSEFSCPVIVLEMAIEDSIAPVKIFRRSNSNN